MKNLDNRIAKEAENRDKKEQILDDRKSQRSQSAQSHVSRRSMGSRGGLSAQALNQLNKNNETASRQGGDVMSQRSGRSHHSQTRSFASRTHVSKYSEINEDDEWLAIQKFNTLLHLEEQKQALMREEERKRLIKEELDKQVNAKKLRTQTLNQENQLYDEMHNEHGKLLAQREREKADAIRAKILADKAGRDQQLKEEQRRRKNE